MFDWFDVVLVILGVMIAGGLILAGTAIAAMGRDDPENDE
jgi:hypothetical protein